MKKIEGGICAVSGVSANGIKTGKMGLAVIVAAGPAAGVFTRNKVIAAPLIVTKRHLEARPHLSAVIINSGNANAFTGAEGLKDAETMASLVAEKLGLEPEDIGVASTGVIGRKLDISWIEQELPGVFKEIVASAEGGRAAAKAIMTTDTVMKESTVELESGIRIGGIAKGSGMIEPNMGTMLSFVYTDADVPADVLQAALRDAVDRSFNMIVVDGDTSTNDMALLTATGKSGIKPCLEDLEEFGQGVEYVLTDLAKMIARDGEGATKLIEARVTGAKTHEDARLAAKAIVRSPLVKTAIFGKDPNWGRVVAAAGYSGADLDPEKISLAFAGGGKEVELVKAGKTAGTQGSLESLKEIMASKEIVINVNLGLGEESAIAWGCDLTYDYVRINAEYTT